MGKRGIKPQVRINTIWSPNLAYAIGLIVTDGNLSQFGNRITFVSKDIEQIHNLNKCLMLKNKVGINKSGIKREVSYRVQFRDVLFFDFLLRIGVSPCKSKTIKEVLIPKEYYFDFLRGHLDGDGCFYSYWDKRWKSSFMYYLTFASASREHIYWMREMTKSQLNILGHVTKAKSNSCYQLKYAKSESEKILKKIYHKEDLICLKRKRLKIKKILGSIVK